jgi:hypothetical protein
MFSFFGKKPNRATQRQYIEQADRLVESFMYIETYGGIIPKEGKEPLLLSVEKNRKDITFRLCELIQAHKLNQLNYKYNPIGFNQAVREIIINNANSDDGDDALDAAVGILVLFPIIEHISHQYYECYPSYKHLFEMVNNIAKITMPTVFNLFDGNMPPEVRDSFPYVSQMFESYRASL